jgi:hypothetical protein
MRLEVVDGFDVRGGRGCCEEKLDDGERSAVGEGDCGPFCSWTRLARLALLIWVDLAKSGVVSAGDVIWRKIHPVPLTRLRDGPSATTRSEMHPWSGVELTTRQKCPDRITCA